MPLIPKLTIVFRYTCDGKYTENQINKFINKIKINRKNECWEWVGHITVQGYGHFSRGRKHPQNKAHRVAYEISTNKLIPEGLLVCHHCDNRKCVNPKHLWLGTIRDNDLDRNNKNRQACGENNGAAKLTWKKVKEIRHKYNNENYTHRQLSKEYNANNMSKIIMNKAWRDQNYVPPISRMGRNKYSNAANT